MYILDYIKLCDDCGSQMVHGICTLCGHEELQSTREDDPRELNFQTDAAYTDEGKP